MHDNVLVCVCVCTISEFPLSNIFVIFVNFIAKRFVKLVFCKLTMVVNHAI